jgi:hypothetical protein
MREARRVLRANGDLSVHQDLKVSVVIQAHKVRPGWPHLALSMPSGSQSWRLETPN